jgi:mono/diheme cytochrome c family protein
MRALRLAIVFAVVGAIAGIAAGCGGSDPNEAKTPTNAPTITNGQLPTETTGGGAEGGGGAGDATAGKATFEGTCQSCHLAGGTQAGTGPVLADRGLAADAIRKQITNPVGVMPANLVSGADLDNVVAFVAGLQGGAAAGGGTTTGAGGGTSTQAGGGGGDAAAIAAGKTFFEGTCQGCHAAGGTQAGAGPVLAGRGLTEDAIKTQIQTPRGVMPANLASGQDLESVTKFVLSIQ